MSKKRGSILGNLGQGLAGDILLFAAVILIMSLFAVSSISKAYLVALILLIAIVAPFVFYRRYKN